MRPSSDLAAPRFERIGNYTRALAASGALLLGAAACSAVEPAPTQEVGTTIGTIEQDTSALRAEVEQKYDIEIRTLEDDYKARGEDYEAFVAKYPEAGAKTPRKWSVDQLNLLDNALGRLPKHLYAPRDNGDKVSFIVNYYIGTCCGEEPIQGFPHQVALADGFFDVQKPEILQEHAAHELTHMADPRDIVLAGQDRSKGRGTLASTWDPLVDAALGVPYKELYLSKKLLNNFTAGVKDGSFDNDFDEYIAYAWGHADGKHPSEFLAVGSQFYLHGKDYFVKGYGRLFDGVTDSAAPEWLYNFYRDTVFHGTEYQNFVPTTPVK